MLIKHHNITVNEIRTFKNQNDYYLNTYDFIIKYYTWVEKYKLPFSPVLSQRERNKAYHELKQIINEAKEYMSNEVV